MPNYRRAYIPGSTVFLTWTTYRRMPLFKDYGNVILFRQAVRQIKAETPFDIIAAAILHDHVYVIWTLPDGDSNYSKRVASTFYFLGTTR